MRAAAVNSSATPALLRALVVCSRVAVPSLPEATLPPPRGPARKARGKSPPPSLRDRRRPTEKGPGNSPHTGCQPPPTERISNIGLVLLLSFAGLSNGIADLFFLILPSRSRRREEAQIESDTPSEGIQSLLTSAATSLAQSGLSN